MELISITALLAVVPIVTFLLFYVYMTSEYLYWEKRKVPFIKPAFPYGNIKDLVRTKIDIGRCFKALYDQMPGQRYFGVFELGRPTLVLKDPEIIKAVMVTDFYHFADRGHVHEDVKKDFVIASQLFNLKNKAWKQMRLKLSPAFSSGRLKAMYQLMVKSSQQLDQFLDRAAITNQKVEFRDLLARFTSDVVSTCFFGLESNAIFEEGSKVREISKIIFSPSALNTIKLMLSINQPYIYDLLGLTINVKEVNDFCMTVAKDTYNYRLTNNVYRDDFIDLLIKMKQNINLYDDEKAVSQGPRQSQGTDDETLRLHPSAPILSRKCIKSYKIPNEDLVIEKGLRVVIPTLAINMDPEVYPDPLRFDPERFSPANMRERKMPNLHFGDGPMVCIGMRFGKMQAKCALATILSKYEVCVVPETPDRITLDPRQFILTPMEPLYLGVARRTDR